MVLNSKYPLLGGLRSSAQMVSYELALTMSVVGVLLMAGSSACATSSTIKPMARPFGLGGIFRWNILAAFPAILGFLCFFVAAVAETNRVPFDLPEAESELVAGFTPNTQLQVRHVLHRRIHQHDHRLRLCAILFFGGWLSPFPVSWTFTHYCPRYPDTSGLWGHLGRSALRNHLRQLILPGVGTVIAA